MCRLRVREERELFYAFGTREFLVVPEWSVVVVAVIIYKKVDEDCV